MVRKHLYFDKSQIDFIESLPGTFAEHVRQAVNNYIDSKKYSASASRKEGNG